MKKIKNILKRIPIIGKLTFSIFRIIKPYHIGSSSYWINQYLPNKKITVVQIGSNDGLSGDPIHEFVKLNRNWKVLFVEPVHHIFEELKKNYGIEKRFKFENAAINSNGANQVFYSVKQEAYEQIPNLSPDHNQIGSFYKENVIRLSNGVLEGYIEEKEVNCLTLDQLFVKNDIKDVTFLHIDAEGYDWKILSQLDLESFNPLLILFESLNLEEAEKKEAINFLKDQYFIISFRIDFLCINKHIITKKDLQTIKRKRLLLDPV